MIPVTSRKGQSIALFGLGGSGLACAQALLEGGARPVAWDDNPESVEKAQALGIPVADLRGMDFAAMDTLVLAPGVPLTHPKPHWSVELAKKAGVEIVGDVGLFSEERRSRESSSDFIAITGTNGKSTTTALISHMFRVSGRDVQMGGNIGKPVLSLAPFSDDRTYVVECSSYQIDLAPRLDPGIGILLNLAPDHLDRHGTMENYAAIKARLVQSSGQAVIGVDDAHTRAIADQLYGAGHDICRISGKEPVSGRGVHVDNGDVISTLGGEARKIASLDGIATLRGSHNAQNAAAACAACSLAGLGDDEIQSGLSSFPGLAHRMEIVGNLGKTVFVNDSKGTNADAAAMALSSFENIYWIAGGLAKEGGIDALRPLFPRLRKAFLIGEAAPGFAATLGSDVPFEIAGTLDNAVAGATDAATRSGEEAVVLLSPACASFDQFRNFELRGDAFREQVLQIEGLIPYGEEAR